MNPFLSLVAVLLMVAGVLLWPLINSFRRAPAEQNLKPFWQQRCSVGSRGFGIGAGTNMPFTRVALYSDFMIMRGFATTVIPYQDITEVIWKRNFLSLGGVLIRLRGLKSSYVLYPRSPKSFVSLIESQLILRSSETAQKRAAP
ncbi:MAG: PH domain-containing protein [Methylobacter sp.]